MQEADQRRSVLGNVLTRLVGASGFQLINVTNAYISLQGMSIDNCLVNRVSASLSTLPSLYVA